MFYDTNGCLFIIFLCFNIGYKSVLLRKNVVLQNQELLRVSHLNGSVLFLTAFIIFSVPASVIDIKQKRIPDWIVFPGVIVLLGFRVFGFDDPAIKILSDIILGSLIFIGIRFFTKGKLGMEDVKFAALMGVGLCWFPRVVYCSWISLSFGIDVCFDWNRLWKSE